MDSQPVTPIEPEAVEPEAVEPEAGRGAPLLWRVWGEARRVAGNPLGVGEALLASRTRRFAHGAGLPWKVLRTLLAEPRLRRRYLTVSLAQAGTILALALLVTSRGKEMTERMGYRLTPEAKAAASAPGKTDGEQEAESATEEAEEAESAPEEAEAVASAPEETDGEGDPVQVELAPRAPGALPSLKRVKVHMNWDLPGNLSPETMGWLVYAAALLSSLQLVQWAVIALTRDFHTELSREAGLLMGLPAEDEPRAPRVRIDLKWMGNKFKRRMRALVVFSMGLPVLWLLRPLPWGGLLSSVLLSLWGAWWFTVFTAGKSSLAWREQAPREPTFLRAVTALTSRFWPLRPYGSVWTRVTRPVFSPIAQVEREPWGFAGLALVRALSALPLVKCFLRPIMPVAAAHLLLAGEAARATDPPEAPRAEAPGELASPGPRELSA